MQGERGQCTLDWWWRERLREYGADLGVVEGLLYRGIRGHVVQEVLVEVQS